MLREVCRTMALKTPPTRAALGHVVTALLLTLFSQIEHSETLPNSERRGHGDAVVQEICALILSRFDQELPLDRVADTFGVSRRHATRIFRERTGFSIAEYHENVRMDAAVKLLTETDLAVSEIAMRVGYDSGSALARAVRRLLGCSPSAIRNSDTSNVIRRAPLMTFFRKQTSVSR
jgi:AraC family transcriptional regulator